MSGTLTLAQLVAQTRLVAETYPDSENRQYGDGPTRCHHFDENLRPSCVVGHAFDALELDEPDREEVSGASVFEAVELLGVEWKGDGGMQDLDLIWLMVVQHVADAPRTTWGYAVEVADEYLKMHQPYYPAEIVPLLILQAHENVMERNAFEQAKSRYRHPTARKVEASS